MKRSKWAYLALMLAVAMIAAACGDNGDTEEPDAPPAEEPEETEDEPDGPASHPAPEDLDEFFIRIATGGTGGTYFPLGGVLATMLNDRLPNLTASSEVTGATSENLRLLQSEEVQIGLGHTDSVSPALQGIGPFEGEAMPNLRALGIVFTSYTQVVSRADQACIETVDDLLGSTWSIGEPGSATAVGSESLITNLGYSFADMRSTPQLGFADSTASFRDNQIDAGTYMGAPMMAALEDLTSTFEICMLQLSDAEMDQIRSNPATAHIANGVIPAGTYPNQTEDWGNIPSAINTYTVLDTFPRDYAYWVTKILHDEVQRLIDTHPSAEDTTIEQLLRLNAIVPLHPGSIDYILEEGYELSDIPAQLIPDDYEPLS